MKCPKCEGETAVVDSRDSDGYKRRRRKCKRCFHRFSTVEAVSQVEEGDQESLIIPFVRLAPTQELLKEIGKRIDDRADDVQG